MVPGAAPPVWRDSPVMLGLVLVSAKDRETAFLVDLPLARMETDADPVSDIGKRVRQRQCRSLAMPLFTRVSLAAG